MRLEGGKSEAGGGTSLRLDRYVIAIQQKEQDEVHYGRKGMKRCIYLDIFDVLSNFDSRTNDLMTNHLRIVNFAPAGAHRMLRGELVPKRWQLVEWVQTKSLAQIPQYRILISTSSSSHFLASYSCHLSWPLTAFLDGESKTTCWGENSEEVLV